MQQRQCLKRWWLKIFQNGLKTDQEFPQIQTIQTKRIPLLDTSQWILGHQRWWEDLKSTQRKGVISRKRQLKWQLNSQKDCIYNKILIPYYRRLCMICGALFFFTFSMLFSPSLPCSDSQEFSHFHDHIFPNLCTFFSICLNCPAISSHMTISFSSLRSRPKCHFFNRVFPKQPVYSNSY